MSDESVKLSRLEPRPGEGPEDGDWAWHALNYRTAASPHAEAMFRELEQHIGRMIAAAVLAERERAARLAESMMDPQDDGWDACLRTVAAAIRAG